MPCARYTVLNVVSGLVNHTFRPLCPQEKNAGVHKLGGTFFVTARTEPQSGAVALACQIRILALWQASAAI
jgi:6-phosphofructokinase